MHRTLGLYPSSGRQQRVSWDDAIVYPELEKSWFFVLAF